MKLNHKISRGMALLAGGAVLSSTLLTATPARADKSKNYKIGAIALGAIAAYKLSKGDTLVGAAAGAGAYYAYKKSQDADDDRYGYGYDRDNDRYDNNRYPDNYDNGYYGDTNDPGYYGNDGYYGSDRNEGRNGRRNDSGRYGRNDDRRDDNRYPGSSYLAPEAGHDLQPVLR